MSAAGVSRSADIAATGVPGLTVNEGLVLGDGVRGTGTLSLYVPLVTMALLNFDIAVGRSHHPDVAEFHRSQI